MKTSANHRVPLDTPLEPTFGLKAYQSLSRLAGPIANLTLQRRLASRKEDPVRIDERRGQTTEARPEGPLAWIHGASVGESLSVLPLVKRLREARPELTLLVTTGTTTSAALMKERLPAGAVHQYAPVDHPDFVERFLDHWRPTIAVFVESEFWPNLLIRTRQTTPFLALVNGRISPKSFDAWSKRPKSIRYLLSCFDVLIAQDQKNADRLSNLSGQNVQTFGNLKNAAPALPVDETDLDAIREMIGSRPLWLAASTHPSEEEVILSAHRLLSEEFPDLLTIIAPRHPTRGAEVMDLSGAERLKAQRRSQTPEIKTDTQIYIADTLGELGLFYRLSNVAFVGGSILKKGGHNPLEPARLGCSILHGPYTFNFDETYSDMRGAGGAALVRNERDLATAIRRLFKDEKTRITMADAARQSAEQSAERVLTSVSDTLISQLPVQATCSTS